MPLRRSAWRSRIYHTEPHVQKSYFVLRCLFVEPFEHRMIERDYSERIFRFVFSEQFDKGVINAWIFDGRVLYLNKYRHLAVDQVEHL